MTVSASEQIISDPFPDQSKQKSCSNCGESFTCGPAAGKGNCWCEELPHVSLVAGADQDCLCPECLSEAIAKLPSADADISTSTAGAITSSPALVEGEDYYCEGAVIVFTAHFLLRRGYCCQSGCRHCPYETAQLNNQAISAAE
jgi:Family of unknown function (DUF5522)/Cysteine-rich CWC